MRPGAVEVFGLRVGYGPRSAWPALQSGAAVALVEVRRHPAGGWTHAHLVEGTRRIYRGNWPTKTAAARAL